MDEQQPTRIAWYRCTFYNTALRTIHSVDVEVPEYGTQPAMSVSEGIAWKKAEQIVQTWERKGVSFRDLTRHTIQRSEELRP